MKPKIKRIIAREGLIIISLVVLAVIFLLVDTRVYEIKSNYEANAQEIEPTLISEETNKYLLSSFQGIILRFPKNTNHDVIKQTIRRDFPNIKFDDFHIYDSNKGENIKASYDNNGNRVLKSFIYKIKWANAFVFFLTCAYPLYLTIRFIIWAIGTLRGKKEIDVQLISE